VAAFVVWRTHRSHLAKAPTVVPSHLISNKISPNPLPENSQAVIPLGSSPEMAEFIQNRTTLMNNFAQCHNQLLKTNPSATAEDQEKLFQQQNAALLLRQSQLTQLVAQQQAQKPLPLPPPLQLPPDSSPQLKAYLIARDKLMRDQIETMNKYRTADPKARQDAMLQWQKQNAARLQELRQLAQALPKATKT
jgi:hypothetical protein